MIIRRLAECPEVTVMDGSIMRELANAATEKRSFGYSFARMIVKPGQKTIPHRLKVSETYYILSGSGMMHVGGEIEEVEAGCFIEVPPMAEQWIENIAKIDLAFICIVDPAWRKEYEII